MNADPAGRTAAAGGADPEGADPAGVDQARRLARALFPDALAVVLAGSTAAGRAGATSDLDVAVLVKDGGETYRETIRFEGRVVELFVHTRAGLEELFAADVAARRGTLQSMYATGLVLLDVDGAAGRARARAETDLRKGPPAWDPQTVETKRYVLTDALDDLSDAGDRIERLAVAGVVLGAAAELLLEHHQAWSGGGKWLPRRLREADARRGGALLEGHLHLCESGDPGPMLDAVSEILDLVGGPLREGYRRTWHGVIESLALPGTASGAPASAAAGRG
ncbi:nucleotidyltransferase domain-containing protein [Streptomyces sp. NBC_01351]|uniref:nucleotidyltransferase domain-containing protein n=1 Tax=Streptomyces sp. NBC_01351 TaxID=2903833 RepID=UPI002E335BBD|nr:nucleotidyltransferase domain-containing protein [Streptomyces sp. NBC_01351]